MKCNTVLYLHMANKCLEFCQTLASQGQKFFFSLNTACNFNYSLDTKEKSTSLDTSMVSTLQQSMKKKLSPSQLRRNMKRKQDFLKLKSEKSKTMAMSEKELSDLNAKIFRLVTCEMQLKRKPPCDISYLKLAVSKIIKKHMKA